MSETLEAAKTAFSKYNIEDDVGGYSVSLHRWCIEQASLSDNVNIEAICQVIY